MKKFIHFVGPGSIGFVVQNLWYSQYDGGISYQRPEHPGQLFCYFICGGTPTRDNRSE